MLLWGCQHVLHICWKLKWGCFSGGHSITRQHFFGLYAWSAGVLRSVESKGFAFLSTCYSGSLCGNLDTVKVVYSFIQSTELILLLVALINCWSSRVPIKIAWSSCTSDFELINLSILYRWHSLTISLFMQNVHIIPTKCPINLQSIHTILLIFNLL